MSMMSFLGLGGSGVNVTFSLSDAANRPQKLIKDADQVERSLPVFRDGDDVSGQVHLSPKKTGSRIEHQGVRVEFIGQVELNPDKNIVSASSSGGSSVHEFVANSKLIAYPGELSAPATYDFSFVNADKPFESYYGTNVRLRYFLRLSIQKRFSNTVVEEDLFVEAAGKAEATGPPAKPINMEVGIEDCLHIEFEYDKSRYHLKDAIVGKIYFSLVRIKVKYMEIALVRKETVGSGAGIFSDNEIIAHHEILDGAPSKGETVPIRMFLAAYDSLTPTMKDVREKFSVQYYLNLVLVDEDDRRYFKQQEIILWRKAESEFLQPKEVIHTLPKMVPVEPAEIVVDRMVETALVEG